MRRWRNSRVFARTQVHVKNEGFLLCGRIVLNEWCPERNCIWSCLFGTVLVYILNVLFCFLLKTRKQNPLAISSAHTLRLTHKLQNSSFIEQQDYSKILDNVSLYNFMRVSWMLHYIQNLVMNAIWNALAINYQQ